MKISNATVIVLLCIFIHMLGVGSDNIYFHVLNKNPSVVFLVCQGLAYLLYPLLGWLADVQFTRYKFVKSSFVLMLVGSCVLVFFLIGNLLTHGVHIELYVVGGLSLMACLFALGMFEATAVQFGMDQMLKDPSDKLSTFIQWYYWGSKLGRLLLCFLVTGLFYYYSNCQMVYQRNYHYVKHVYILIIGSMFCLVFGIQQIAFVIASLWLLKHTKKHLAIDQIGSSPWTLVYQVLKYAWQHKCPERRSAFTYWEEDIPPRIDLGKRKYGGPFTTEEVEDTKTFLSILLLLPLLGSHLSGSGYSVVNQLVKVHCPPF